MSLNLLLVRHLAIRLLKCFCGFFCCWPIPWRGGGWGWPISVFVAAFSFGVEARGVGHAKGLTCVVMVVVTMDRPSCRCLHLCRPGCEAPPVVLWWPEGVPPNWCCGCHRRLSWCYRCFGSSYRWPEVLMYVLYCVQTIFALERKHRHF